MVNLIDNYNVLYDIMSEYFDEVTGFDFYNYIFPNNEVSGYLKNDYTQPNAIYLYRDDRDIGIQRRVRRRIMLVDTWEKDFDYYVKGTQLTLCSGLSYRGRTNRLEHAQQMNAMVFDLDAVGENELKNLLSRIGKKKALRTLPQPTFIVLSGTGLHLYYVFKEPINLFPNIKLQLKQLKYDLTFRIWEYKGTSQQKNIQYQSINQSFRMVGSINDKYNLPIVAFKTGGRVDLDYLNEYVIEDKNKVDLSQPFAPTKYTLEEAKEIFPEWYERVIVKKNKKQQKWHIKRDLYNWWIRQADKVKGGHRYFFLMCMCIYGVKCDVSKKEVEKDMRKIFEELSVIEHSNKLSEDDIMSALETYDRGYYNFTIDDIIKLTDIHIEKNKRNYRKQSDHIKLMNTMKMFKKEMGEDINEGRPPKKELVREYIKSNPKANPTEIARELKISRTTVYKYLNK